MKFPPFIADAVQSAGKILCRSPTLIRGASERFLIASSGGPPNLADIDNRGSSTIAGRSGLPAFRFL